MRRFNVGKFPAKLFGVVAAFAIVFGVSLAVVPAASAVEESTPNVNITSYELSCYLVEDAGVGQIGFDVEYNTVGMPDGTPGSAVFTTVSTDGSVGPFDTNVYATDAATDGSSFRSATPQEYNNQIVRGTYKVTLTLTIGGISAVQTKQITCPEGGGGNPDPDPEPTDPTTPVAASITDHSLSPSSDGTGIDYSVKVDLGTQESATVIIGHGDSETPDATVVFTESGEQSGSIDLACGTYEFGIFFEGAATGPAATQTVTITCPEGGGGNPDPEPTTEPTPTEPVTVQQPSQATPPGKLGGVGAGDGDGSSFPLGNLVPIGLIGFGVIMLGALGLGVRRKV